MCNQYSYQTHSQTDHANNDLVFWWLGTIQNWSDKVHKGHQQLLFEFRCKHSSDQAIIIWSLKSSLVLLPIWFRFDHAIPDSQTTAILLWYRYNLSCKMLKWKPVCSFCQALRCQDKNIKPVPSYLPACQSLPTALLWKAW